MYAVMTQSMRSTPLSSPTIVGMAALSTVWLSEASSIASMSPTKSRMRPRLDSCERGRSVRALSVRGAGEVIALFLHSMQKC